MGPVFPVWRSPFSSESTAERRRRFVMGEAIALACHQLADVPCVYRDELPARLLGLSLETVRDVVGDDRDFRLARFYTAARHRFVAESVAAAVLGGMRQVVILDAGLATVAYRKFPSGVRIFETDEASDQTWKRYRLADIGAEIPESLRFVESDGAPLAAALADAGFDRAKPALFSWTGTVPITPLPDVRSTLDYVGSCPDAQLIIDYVEPPGAAAAPDAGGPGPDRVTAFEPGAAAELLHAAGFGGIQDQRGSTLVARYAPDAAAGAVPATVHLVRATAHR